MESENGKGTFSKKEGLFVIENGENREFSGFCERECGVWDQESGFPGHGNDVLNQISTFQDSGSMEMEKYPFPVIEIAAYFFPDADIRDREKGIFDSRRDGEVSQ